MTYNGGERYVINPKARLRNEGKYVIAAFPDEVAVPLLRLNPIAAVAVSLFDGRRTCDEVAEICSVMVSGNCQNPVQASRSMLQAVLECHLQPQGSVTDPLLLACSDLPPEQQSQTREIRTPDYIVRPEDYRPHDPHLAFPTSILWLLTNDCQTSCQYCYMHKPELAKKDLLPFGRVRELVKEAVNRGIFGIYVSGGDVLCYPHLFDFLELMDEYDIQPTVLATKSYVSPETAARLKQYRYVRGLQFSIDSTVPEIADFLVQSPGFCERIFKSIRHAQEAGIERVEIKSVITPYNLPTIPKLYRDMRALGITEIRMATYCKSGYHHKAKLFNHPDDYKWLDAQFEKLRQEFPGEKIHYQNGPPKLEPDSIEERRRFWDKRAACTAGRTNITITAFGKIVACEQMPEREGDYMGDLRTQSLAEVWDGALLDEYLLHPPRERFQGTACFNCDEFDKCQIELGQCVRDNIIHYGTRWCPSAMCPKAPEQYMRAM